MQENRNQEIIIPENTDPESTEPKKMEKDQSAHVPRTKHLLEFSMSETLEHGRMVSNLAWHIAHEIGMSDEQIRNVTIAGLFHDIGKTEIEKIYSITDESALLVEEMNSVREHPTKGYEILKRHGYNEEICQAVLHHHENNDGSGFPDNLEGWNIPVDACILRVCDFFCSLVSDRPYRRAFSGEAAMEMMIEEIKKFDIKVFLAFQRIVHADDSGKIALPEIPDEVRGVWKTVWN